jgi:hypothetical protein
LNKTKQEQNIQLNKNKTFNYGKCPNLTFNYSLGKQATKNVEYITSLKEEKNKFKDITTTFLTFGNDAIGNGCKRVA